MKTSYHYFTFIIISVLLHYLFFSLTDTETVVSSENKKVSTSQLNNSPTSPELADSSSLSTVNLPLDESTQAKYTVNPIVEQKTDTHGSTELAINESTILPSQEETKVAQLLDKPLPELNNTNLKTLPVDSLEVQQAENNQEIVTHKAEKMSTAAVQAAPKLNNTQLNKPPYSVTPKTHKATDSALLKAELFEQQIVDLPKLPKKRSTKEKVVVRTTKVASIKQKPTTSDSKTSLTINKNSATPLITSKVVKKPTFKPKVDTELLNLSETIKLPEAVAISGKKPDYPSAAASFNKKGQVIASMTVLPTGSTKEAQIVKSSGYKELDQAVIDFIGQERFMPSLQGQDKVSSKQVFSFSYE
ncbi:MAG: energy transducer TonB [Psychromonas sp.]